MSNLIKSGFVAFSEDKTIVIDANENKIIKGIDSAIEEAAATAETSVEEAIAEAMLEDAELDGLELADTDTSLTMDTTLLPDLTDVLTSNANTSAEDIINSAKREAEDIVSRAHDEAEQLRADAFDEATSIREQAKKEGYQEGYNNGSGQIEQELEEQRRQLEQMISDQEASFELKQKELIKETENNIARWLIDMISHITGVSIEGMHGVLMYMINCAMKELDNSRNFVIKVSPDDYEEVLQNKDNIYGALNPGIKLEIFEDSKLSKMQCLIETDNGIVDLSLDVQLGNLKKALKMMIKE